MSCFRKPKIIATDSVTDGSDQIVPIMSGKVEEPGLFEVERRTAETVSATEGFEVDYLLPPPERPGTKTLVFDLDDTLIKSFFDPNSKAEVEVKLEITPQTSDLQEDFNLDYIPVYIAVRSGAHELLKRLSKNYELILWTASVEEYAETILRATKLGQYFEYRFFREECSVHDNMSCYKDIRRLNRDLHNMVLIDDQLTSVKDLQSNQILIERFDGGPDSLLPRLEELFIELVEEETILGKFPQRWFEGEM